MMMMRRRSVNRGHSCTDDDGDVGFYGYDGCGDGFYDDDGEEE